MPIKSRLRDVFGVRCIALIGACCVLSATCSVILAGDRRQRSSTLIDREVFDGKTLFEKSWEPGKRSPRGETGLGRFITKSPASHATTRAAQVVRALKNTMWRC